MCVGCAALSVGAGKGVEGWGFVSPFSTLLCIPPLLPSLLFYLLVCFGSSLDRRPTGWSRVYGQLCLDLLSFFSLLSLDSASHAPGRGILFSFFLLHHEAVPFVSQTRDIRPISSHSTRDHHTRTRLVAGPQLRGEHRGPTQVEHECLPAASLLDF